MKVYIDAGHRNNNNDYGASWKGRRESKDALTLAQLVECNLKALGIETKLSRNTEFTFKGLKSRTDEANQWRADLYLSIHRNASTSHQGKGVETLIYSSAANNMEVAVKLQHAMVDCGFKSRGIKSRPDLHVLQATEMVAVLLEVGFIDHDEDNAKFDEKKNELAVAIAKAITDKL